MGSFEMKNNGTEKGLVEINYHKLYTHKEVKGGFVGQRQGQSVEEESKINEVIEAIHSERERTMGAQDGMQKMQQQPQPPGPVVCWERFLPLRSLKVLLVVNDDSTRHVISALLRNCSYEVAAAANGVHAWKILQDPTNHIDLVLTEVVMPCLSGIGLLCKIMSHNTFKNIPVIMMSSHDSMGIVFKCLSKGAVDFLVKPIRKNELKNLWQHVWRRCHSSSGSRSESGISPQQNAKSNSVERSDNNTGSNDEDENDSVELGVREGSDNGSGTQSSCTKQAVEVDSPEQMSLWQQLDLPYSKCPRSILSENEGLDSNWVPLVTKDKQQEEEEKSHDNVQVGKDKEIRVLGNPDLQNEDASDQIYTNLTSTQDNLLELELSKDYVRSKEGSMELNRGVPIGESRTHAAKDNNNIALISNCVDKRIETNLSEAPSGLYKVSDIKNTITSDSRESLSLELSLKRLRGTGDVGRDDHDERNVLRRTNLSAFSRYNSSDAMKADSTYNQQSSGSSNNKRMAPTTKNNAVKLSALDEQSAATSAAICLHPSAIRPVQNEGTCPPQQILPQKADNVVVTTLVEQPGGVNQQVQVQHHHHHYHHHHHHVHDKKEQLQQQEQEQPENDDSSHDIRSGSSNLFGSLEGNGGNYSLNGSVSGSNHGSSVPNGSSKTLNIGGMNIESDNGKSEAGAGSGSGSGSGTEPNRLTQREAALNKFRQKRKDRCFEKKVRYQSRKTLAEQRPRVRGQFVRQEHTSQDEKS